MVLYQGDQGLVQGLGQGLQGLLGGIAQGQQKRVQQQSRQDIGSIIDQAIASTGDAGLTEESIMDLALKLSSQRGGQETLSSLAPFLSPMLKSNEKRQDKIGQLRTAQSTLGRMEELLDQGLVGTKLGKDIFSGVRGGKTREARGEFTKLGQSIIPLVSSGVAIRNQKEFEEYKKIITDPTAQSSELKGALKGVKSLIDAGLKETQRSSGRPIEQAQRFKKVSKGTPITEDIVVQLLDYSKGDRNKANDLAVSLGYEVEID